MRSLAIINQKGGAGKTTTAVNVADALAREGRRVLLIDLDPQSHASLHLGVQVGAEEAGIYDVLIGGLAAADAMRTINGRLCLLPAGIDLVGAELELRERVAWERILRSALQPYREAFDFCLIDCPPSLGQLTISALVTADEVLIPLQPHFLALQGLGRLLETIQLVRQDLNPHLRVCGVAFCMFEKGTRLAQEVLEDVQRFLDSAEPDTPWHGARLFEAKVRRNVKLAECPSFGQTIFDYAPGSNGAEDYLALAREIAALSRAPAAAAEPEIERPVTKAVEEVVVAAAAAPIFPEPPAPAPVRRRAAGAAAQVAAKRAAP